MSRRTVTPPPLTPADCRAAIAATGLPIYLIAAKVRVHPCALSPMIRGRCPLTQALALRIIEACREAAS